MNLQLIKVIFFYLAAIRINYLNSFHKKTLPQQGSLTLTFFTFFFILVLFGLVPYFNVVIRSNSG